MNAAAFSLFGVRMVSMRYPLALLTVIQAGLMFLVLKRAGTATALMGGLALTSLSFVQFLNPTPNWYTLFLAVAIIAWLSWNPTGLQWRHVVTGFLLGTAFLFRQLTGVFLASGVLVFLLLEKSADGASGSPRLARITLALIAIGNAWYILRVTDPVGWVLFGVWPLAIVLWAWLRTKRSDSEVLALLRDLSIGALISAASAPRLPPRSWSLGRLVPRHFRRSNIDSNARVHEKTRILHAGNRVLARLSIR